MAEFLECHINYRNLPHVNTRSLPFMKHFRSLYTFSNSSIVSVVFEWTLQRIKRVKTSSKLRGTTKTALPQKLDRHGRDPFDQNFRKFRYKIKWNRTFLEIRFENCGQPPEVVLFSGNLEIPEISCSIWHFYPVRIDPSSFSREKLQDGGE